ncbi:M48 family metallopeptidase [Nonomuraea sp. KC401]|uniref:M48 family metallopeptidase n=1 Tax=unclassified Nonomuraea TaxID=2593643 RepID=UPI0010FE7674|nr:MULTISPECIES: M48 family metallopeptidase [unclassified Nonomuraea]NBE95713.1 M48 family metalloprotease [Nonomuraea sp. K271]TLF63961.1 M48 family metallopeptidase [Nonomuraea sp. KC401]
MSGRQDADGPSEEAEAGGETGGPVDGVPAGAVTAQDRAGAATEDGPPGAWTRHERGQGDGMPVTTPDPEPGPDPDQGPAPGPDSALGPAERRFRRQAAVVLGVLAAVILAVAAFSTPWHALTAGPPDPARDFTAAEIARAQAFDAATSLPSYLGLALTLAFAALLVATPFGARVLGRLRGPWWVRVIVGVLVLTAIVEAVRWPLGVWFETVLRDYGLSTQDWAGWTADRLKSLGVEAFLLCLMLLVLVALARRMRRWWIPAAAGACALTVAMSFVYPVVFEPLFNDFTSMPQGSLRDNLLDMAERDGVPVRDVLVADASRRTTALNAYVSGFGATRRIVVYDTLLKAPQPQVELVVAHELGHAKADDVLYGTLVGALGAALGAVLLYLVFGSVRRRAGVASIADPRAVGVVMGLMTLGSLIMGPAQNVISRHIEARADVHALDLTRDPATFIAMQKRLAVTNISDLSPDAVEYVLYASHPSSPERIALARSWAELNGVPVS